MKKLISTIMFFLIILIYSINSTSFAAGNVQLVTNGYTSFIIDTYGNVQGWGRNTKGEVGNGTTDNQLTPVNIGELSNISQIILSDDGYGFSFAIDDSGNVYSWGYNGYGQLGIGTTTEQHTPALIPNLNNVSKIYINNYTVYALTISGDVYGWGKNNYGQVGCGNYTTQTSPVKLNAISDIKEIVCKSDVAFALTNSKDVYAWGFGQNYQMGNGTFITGQTIPTKIAALSNVDEVVTNGVASFAICNNHQDAYSWGTAVTYELGTYNEKNRTPNRLWVISDLDTTIDEIIIENITGFAVMGDGSLYGWGNNSYSQLCNGYTFNQGIPVQILNIPRIRQFVFNGYTGLVLGIDGCVYSWGRNSGGEAGTGTSYRLSYATKITILGNNISELFNGGYDMYAKDSDGNMYGWGSNSYGQVGAGNNVSILPPSLITEVYDAIIVKENHSVYAIDEENAVYSWGQNNYGQVGNDTTNNVNTPYELFNSEITTVIGTGNVNSTVPIVGSINALEISITHPANISYSIDPNNEDGFYCADINIQNNSKVRVNIMIQSFKASSEGDIVLQDVLPNAFNWSEMTREETKSNIALGIRYVDATQWMIAQSELVNPLYAIEIDNKYIGTLEQNAIAALSLCGFHGLAFDGNYVSEHELIFIVSIY